MAFVQVTPEERKVPTKPTGDADQPPTDDAPMDGQMGGGKWDTGQSELRSVTTDERMGGGPVFPERGVELDLTVEEPGNPDDGIKDKEQGENI
jgi:hypothetical protein